ncbi:MAG: cation:proton antiporter [Candidatus Cloacimonetes bacterium]|nr:cation:proton antiporter [Candidatus Cloacimonadota bacterium]
MVESHLGSFFPLTNPVLKFSLLLFIILIMPWVFKRIKIPHLIGLILSGALIGPNGINLMLRDSSITLFGTVGLLYIMFIAGLEIDLADFKKNSHKSVIFGAYTFTIPMIMGILSSFYLLKFPLLSSVLIASLFASHTLVTYPIITKYGITKNKAVTIAIGGTMITDVLALLVLAIVVGMTKSTITSQFWIQLFINMVMLSLAIIFMIPYIARKYLKIVDDNVSQYIFILALVFLSAFLAEITGFEAIIGAFLAGLALNQLIPHTSPLMNRIEFIGNALFIPFFLIGVGMLIDFKVIFTDLQTIAIAFTMISVATFSKFLAAYFTQKTFKFSDDQRRVIFGLSNSQAAATLAAVLVGYNIILGTSPDGEAIRLLSTEVLDGTILMILFTCTIASFSTQKGAYHLSLQNNSESQLESSGFDEKVLIPISLDKSVEELIHLGLSIKNKQAKNNLYALKILMTYEQNQDAEKKAKELLSKASKIVAGADQNIHELLRYDFNISNGIYNVVLEQKITDLVLGLHHKKGLTDSFLGKITEGILSKCNTNIFIYHSVQPFNTIKRLVVVFPENAEKEQGFPLIIVRLWNLSLNNGIKLIVFAHNNTHNFINDYKKKKHIEIEQIEFFDWNDFLIISSKVQNNDGLFIFMSREGSVSYNSVMPKISKYLNKYFIKNNFLLVYPTQCGVECRDSSDDYQQFFIRTFANKSKKIKSLNIFKRG